MTDSENEKIVKKIFEARNQNDFEAHMSHLSDDATFVMPSGHTTDKEGVIKERTISGTAESFPDGIIRVDRMVSQGDTVWVELTFTGTHKGAWYGIPATNKKVEYPMVFIFDFEDGKVKIQKAYFDRLRFLNQIQEKAVAEFWDKMQTVPGRVER